MSESVPITAADIQGEIVAGITAMKAADYVVAVLHFESARALMSAIPAFMLGQPQSQVSYSPEQLDATIERVKRLARTQQQAAAAQVSGGGGIVSQATEFVCTRRVR